MAKGQGVTSGELRGLWVLVVLYGCTICCAVLCVVGIPLSALILFIADNDNPGRRVYFFLVVGLAGVACLVCIVYQCRSKHLEEQRRRRFAAIHQPGQQTPTWADRQNQDPRAFGAPDATQYNTARRMVRTAIATEESDGPPSPAGHEEMAAQRVEVVSGTRRMPFAQTSATIWALFFDQVFDIGSRLIAKGIVPKDDLEGLEPWVMLGLPASAVAELAIRSVETNNTNGVTLKSGKKISNLTRPRVGPGTELWGPQINLQAALEAADLTAEEKAWFVQVCFFSGVPAMAEAAPATVPADSARNTEIMGLVGMAIGQAIDITRLHQYTEHFVGVVLGLALLDNPYGGGRRTPSHTSGSST